MVNFTISTVIYTQLKNVTQPPVVTNMRYAKLLKGWMLLKFSWVEKLRDKSVKILVAILWRGVLAATSWEISVGEQAGSGQRIDTKFWVTSKWGSKFESPGDFHESMWECLKGMSEIKDHSLLLSLLPIYRQNGSQRSVSHSSPVKTKTKSEQNVLVVFFGFCLYKKIESVEIERSETIYHLLKALNIKGSSQIF